MLTRRSRLEPESRRLRKCGTRDVRFFWRSWVLLGRRIWYHALPVLINGGIRNLGSGGAGKQRWDFCFSDDQLHVRQRFFTATDRCFTTVRVCAMAPLRSVAPLWHRCYACIPSCTLANRTCTAGLLHAAGYIRTEPFALLTRPFATAIYLGLEATSLDRDNGVKLVSTLLAE